MPISQRRTVLEFCHDVNTAAHLGVSKTHARIRKIFYWPELQADVRLYIAGCEKCSKRKSPQMKKRAPMDIVDSGVPIDRVATDILVELPTTEKGNKYILVVSDYFT